jgi:putative membrane protein
VAPAPEAAQAAETLLTLSRRSLLYAGLSSNHLRTAGLIVGSLLGLYQLAGDVLPLADPNQLIEQAIGVAPQALWQSTLILMIALALGAVMVSLVQTWLRHYDLQLSADNEGFRLVAGLLNRREQLMRHDKLQYLRSSSNPLQDWLGLRSLQLLQVGGSRAGRQAMTIPGCDEAAWEQVRHRMFAPEAEAGMSWGTIHPRVIRRYLIQLGFVPVLIATLALWSQVGAWILLAWLWLGPAYWLARRYQRTFRYGLNGEMLRVRSALLLRREAQLWLYKVQVVHITQSFVQRRAGLASLTLAMATGSVEIPYLPLATAQALRDLLLYQVERAQQDWM